MASEGMFKNMIKIICKRNFFIFNIDILNDLKYIKKLKKTIQILKKNKSNLGISTQLYIMTGLIIYGAF